MILLSGDKDDIISTSYRKENNINANIESEINIKTLICDVFFDGSKKSKINITGLVLVAMTVTLCIYVLIYIYLYEHIYRWIDSWHFSVLINVH